MSSAFWLHRSMLWFRSNGRVIFPAMTRPTQRRETHDKSSTFGRPPKQTAVSPSPLAELRTPLLLQPRDRLMSLTYLRRLQ